MTRCLDERELYAMGDARLSEARAAHARACERCTARLARLRAVRTAMREATSPAAPDWDAIERRILRAARTAEMVRPSHVTRFAPVGLSLAAAALAAVAIVIGTRPEEALTKLRAPAVAQAYVAPVRALAAEPPLVGRVSDEVGAGAPARGAGLSEGSRVAAACGGAALAALGDAVAIDTRDGARMAVASLDAWRPTILLDGGAFYVSVADGALSPELVVLAAHEELTILSGTAEVLLMDGALTVRAVGGPLVAQVEGDTRTLAAGEGLRRALGDGLGVEASGWALEAASPDASMGGAFSASLSAAARGTLPKSVVREVLQANAEKMRVCYESALKRYPRLEALPVTARLKVGVSGRVARVRVGGLGPWPVLEQCLVSVLQEMRFPAPDGGEVELIAPLRLTPRE